MSATVAQTDTEQFEHDMAELIAGRPIQVGPFTVIAPLGGGVTLTDGRGGSSTYRTVEEFDNAVKAAQALVAARGAA